MLDFKTFTEPSANLSTNGTDTAPQFRQRDRHNSLLFFTIESIAHRQNVCHHQRFQMRFPSGDPIFLQKHFQ